MMLMALFQFILMVINLIIGFIKIERKENPSFNFFLAGLCALAGTLQLLK